MKLLKLFLLITFTSISEMSYSQTTAFETVLQDMNIKVADCENFSDSTKIKIATPNCAYVNITGVGKMPWSKTAKASLDMHATMEVYDAQGHYFQKKVLLNAQGQSSMSFDKKNFAVDFCEDEWVGDKTTSIKIGNWVAQDAFHFKAYYLDHFRGTGNIAYKLYDQIIADRSSYSERAGLEDNGARYYPDGFPCAVYLNGEFYGVFAWNLKKDRKNMNMTKDNPTHIHLDGKLGDAHIWKGSIDWSAFEVRNPKTLYTTATEEVEGYEYKKVSDKELIASLEGKCEVVDSKPSDWTDIEIRDTYGDNPPQYLYYQKKENYYELRLRAGLAYSKYDGDKPVELIDETMPYYDPNDKGHVLTAQVKHSLEKLSKYYGELKEMENSKASADEIKAAFEERFDITSLIDYQVFSCITNNYDGYTKNWQWITWDGEKWFVAPYDLDGTFGNYFTGTLILPADWRTAGSKYSSFRYYTAGPAYFISKYYYDEISARYTELRDNNVLTKDNIMSHFQKWSSSVGDFNYAGEWNKWPNSPCNLNTEVNSNWENTNDWTNFSKYPVYADSITYNAGDKCTYKNHIWVATGTTVGVEPCSSIGFYDGLDRVETWLDERFAISDLYASYDADDFMASYSLNISSALWSTICVPFSFAIPEGVTLFSINEVDDDGAFVKKEIAKYTEANKPYLVHGPQGLYLLTGSKEELKSEDATSNPLQDGLLVGTYEDIYVPKEKYVLQNQNGVIAFYRVSNDNSIKLTTNRAYLSLPSTESSKRLKYDIMTEEADDIQIIAADSNDRVDAIFTVSGNRLNSIQTGINIIKYADGRVEKVLMK